MKAGAVASIIAAIISTGGAFGGYMYFRPSNLEDYLKWKGYSLAKADDSNFWKAIYEENVDTFANDFKNVKQEEVDRWKVIKEYCTKALKKQDYTPEVDKALKYCVDEIKTVRGQLVRDEKDLKKLMTKPDEYQVAAAVQGNDKFWALLEAEGKSLSEKTKTYQEWCEKSLNDKPTQGLVGNVNNFCNRKPYSNFRQKLNSDKLVRIEDKDIDEKFDREFKDFTEKSTSTLIETIVGGKDNWAQLVPQFKGDWKTGFKDGFKKAYKKYCEDLDKKTFGEDYLQSYSEYSGICVKKDPAKAKE